MNENKKTVVGAIAILFCCFLGGFILGNHSQASAAELKTQDVPQEIESDTSATNTLLLEQTKENGDSNLKEWTKKYNKTKKDTEKWITKQYKKYKKYLTKKQKKQIKSYKNKVKRAKTIKQLKTYKKKVNKVLKPAKKKKAFDSKSRHKTTITKSGGVYYYNGRRETYYSSNVLYHYMTPKWVCDKEGFWRTKDGYYVVATDAYKKGTVIKGSKGLCKVLDGGCGSTLDYYVRW